MTISAKLIFATQFFPPDTNTAAVYLGKIADGLAEENRVVVLSATPDSGSGANPASNPAVVEIGNWDPEKSALIRRGIAICALAARMFLSVVRRAGRRTSSSA